MNRRREAAREKLSLALNCVKNAEQTLTDFLDFLKTEKYKEWNDEQKAKRVREADNLRPLIQTLSGIETGNIGSQDSVFSSGVGSVSNLESQDQKDFKLLRSSCTIQEILDAMLSPSTGLTFINKNAPL